MFGVEPDKHQHSQTLWPQEQNNCDNQPGHTAAHPLQMWGKEGLAVGGRFASLQAPEGEGA